MIEQRLEICRECSEYVNSVKLGACKQIRDPSERVCAERFAEAVRRGICPLGHFEELNRTGQVVLSAD